MRKAGDPLALIEALKDSDSVVRSECGRGALGNTRADASTIVPVPLLQSIDSEDPRVRSATILSLAVNYPDENFDSSGNSQSALRTRLFAFVKTPPAR